MDMPSAPKVRNMLSFSWVYLSFCLIVSFSRFMTPYTLSKSSVPFVSFQWLMSHINFSYSVEDWADLNFFNQHHLYCYLLPVMLLLMWWFSVKAYFCLCENIIWVFPTCSVLTPYYTEEVLFSLQELEEPNEDGVSILFYLQKIFPGLCFRYSWDLSYFSFSTNLQ